jgi:hypothetical protein
MDGGLGSTRLYLVVLVDLCRKRSPCMSMSFDLVSIDTESI